MTIAIGVINLRLQLSYCSLYSFLKKYQAGITNLFTFIEKIQMLISVLNSIRILPLLLFSVLAPDKLSAQTLPKLKIGAAYSWLYTTHGNHFNGFSISLSKPISRNIDLGLNLGFAVSPLHNTNGLDLSAFKNFPVAAYFKYTAYRVGKFELFTQVKPGISFMRYRQRPESSPLGTAVRVSDHGFYLYTSIGTMYRINDKAGLTLGLGNTFFKLSSNRLDVNPRGTTLRVGCLLAIPR